MKRRSTAAAVTARPVEFLPRRFFLLVVRGTPRFRLDANNTTSHSTASRLPPATPGIEFVELPPGLLEPRGLETRLDASHTIRFCRFLNAARRKHGCAWAAAAGPESSRPPNTNGRPRQIHFVARSHVRGDEAGLVLLLVRWRLLCLELSPAEALAPFQHLQTHLVGSSGGPNVELALAGVARGVASGLLFSKHEFQREVETDGDEGETSPSGRDNNESDAASSFIRITSRFLVFAGPVDQAPGPPAAVLASTESNDAPLTSLGELERPPTVDEPEKPVAAGPESAEKLPRVSVAQLVAQLRQHRVAMVVKLNARPRYDDQLIVRSGVDHLDLSGRSDAEGVDRAVVARFLESCEHSAPQSIVAVHSSTGLGRAALCVASFLVKHARFRAAEAVGWVRFVCPGALPPWHERILETMEPALWRDGDAFRAKWQAAQDELQQRGGVHSPRNSLCRTSLTAAVDDLALASARLAPQISIGKIAFGRDALLGTQKDKASSSSRDREPPLAAFASLSSPAQVVPLQRGPGGGGSFRELVASDAVLGAQQSHTRRPLTQGASGRRRLLDHHQHHHGDFATLHKFLHQSSSPSSSSAACSAYSGSHVTPQRPAATAPDRTSSSTTTTSSTTQGGVSMAASVPTQQQHSFD